MTQFLTQLVSKLENVKNIKIVRFFGIKMEF